MNESDKFFVTLNAPEADDFTVYANFKKAVELEDHNEGQLAVDVAETDSELIIVATMAGTPKDKVELHLHNDLLTIRGERKSPVPAGALEHFKECYFGRFSRSIVLPCDIHPEMAKAEYINGLLVIRLPKIKTDQGIPLYVVEE